MWTPTQEVVQKLFLDFVQASNKYNLTFFPL